MRIEDSGGGWSSTTNFEALSHQQLYDMVQNASPDNVNSIAETLNAASTQVQSIADDLNTHLANLQWTGAAGDSFRSWGRQVVQAMDDLSIFHNNAGVAVDMAGSTLTSVKAAMPPVPTEDMGVVAAYIRQEQFGAPSMGFGPTVIGGRVQPPIGVGPALGPGVISQAQAYAAQSRVDAAHQEAVTQMERLGGAYVGATNTMDINAEPVFPPPPAALMPPRGAGKDQTVYVPTQNGASGDSSTGGGTGTGSVGGVGEVGGATSGGGSGGRSGQRLTSPGRIGVGSTLQGVQPPTKGTGPGAVQPSGGGSSGVTGGGDKSGGGIGVVVVPPGSGGTTRLGGAAGGRSTPPGLNEGGGHTPGVGDAGAPVGEPGIQGGLKSETGISGGAVESGLGAGGATGIDGRGIGGSVAGSVSASAESPIVAGEGSFGSSTARAGLPAERSAAVTGASTGDMSSAGGMMGGGGMGGLANAAGRGRKRGSRAGYLAEDEETWSEAAGQANPAVIE